MPTPPRLSDLGSAPDVETGTLRSRGRRFAELLAIARRHELLPFRRLDFSHDPDKSALRARQADHLRRALEEAGGGFVKMGQLLSTRDDLLPEEWTEGLAHLQRSVTPADPDEVAALLERELGAPVDEVFAAFDPVPVAAASIAQVHRARLTDGTSVAVKVQRPGIDTAVRRDVDIALRVVRFMARLSTEARQVGVQDVAAQYADDLIRQVDFTSELRNLTALRAAQARSARPDEVRFPDPYPELSGRRVLVMEFLEGDTLSAIRAERSDRDLDEPMRAILRAFLRQVVFDGVYHADMHPGNVLLQPDGRPALIDFGSVGRLDPGLRDTVQQLLAAYIQDDTEAIADAVLRMAPVRDAEDEPDFRRAIARFVADELGPGARIGVETVDDAVEVFGRYRLKPPPDFVAAARALAIFEGTLRTLTPSFDLLEESRSLAGEQIRDQLRPGRIRDVAVRELFGAVSAARRLPRRVDRIGEAIETGKLSVNIRLFSDRRDRRTLNGVIRRVLLVLLGAGAGVLSIVYLALPARPTAVLSTGVAGGLLGGAAVVLLVWAAIDAALARKRE
ncbi:ubiquinone biosynthesis protein [Curtobacterium flaccumfaciens]|uniref:Ubiquinone biosynthesis protein n=1 Tax=Curtobacterium flaccumfaciens TaxID=2035 RepID=A0A4R6DJ00_9MICO|nr:AarF/UbiB family protein [Curtobacterium flaccumfaciens]TDN44765.1 ubiquinone biosynthesis protein [Curtobacterium flaccumfaciens]